MADYRLGEVVWRELICPDVARARAFYGELFGWSFLERPGTTEPSPGKSVPITYTMIKNGEAFIGGMLTLPEPSPPPHWMAYVSVEDVDVASERAKASGGSLIHGPQDLPGTGRFSIVKDPAGAAITAFRSSMGDGPSVYPPPVHSFCWESLHSGDASRAVDFYGSVFGWKKMQTGVPDAIVLGTGQTMVCDVQPASAGAPSRFVSHVLVPSLAAARERIPRLGGKVLAPAIPIPSFGQIAVLQDPQGVELAIFEPTQAS